MLRVFRRCSADALFGTRARRAFGEATLPMIAVVGIAMFVAVSLIRGQAERLLSSLKTINYNADVTLRRPWLEACRSQLDLVKQFTPPKTYCDPETSLIFLKTHRTGSSTIQNTILRFGDRNNLTFAFPPRGNYFWFAADIPKEMYPVPGHRFHLFCFHTVMDKSDIKKMMSPRAKWVTVMRDPEHVFESMFRYFGMSGPRYFNQSWEQLLDNPPPPEGRFKMLLYGTNQISLDLGMSVHHFHIPNRVKAYLQFLEETFSLVMIAEQMDESLVLLRHHLCWDITDVASFHFNARFNKARSADPLDSLTEKQRRNLKIITSADRVLYDKFKSLFEARKVAFGAERMNVETEALRCVREELKKSCGVKTLKANFIQPSGMFQPYGPAMGFIPDPDPNFKGYEEFDWICNAMSYTEERYIDVLREKQKSWHRSDLFAAKQR